GTAADGYMVPDCFGFPASRPSLLAHAGIKGFSTQKLTWHSSAPVGGPDSPEETPVGIPFNVGFWQGPDGKGVIAALNPGSYSADVRYDLSSSEASPGMRRFVDWPKRIQQNGGVSGLLTDYHYYGTGDIGGAPSESSVELVEAMVTQGRVVLPQAKSPNERDAKDTSQNAVQVGAGPVRVVSSRADEMFHAIRPAAIPRLPRYSGDLELIE